MTDWPAVADLDEANDFVGGFANATTFLTKVTQRFNALVGRVGDPVWHTITSWTSGYESNDASNGGFQYVAAWNLRDDGLVTMRGGIRKTTGTFPTGSTILVPVLPPAIVPDQDVEWATAMDNAGGATVGRLEIASNNLKIVLETSRGTWVSIDGLSYWVS